MMMFITIFGGQLSLAALSSRPRARLQADRWSNRRRRARPPAVCVYICACVNSVCACVNRVCVCIYVHV